MMRVGPSFIPRQSTACWRCTGESPTVVLFESVHEGATVLIRQCAKPSCRITFTTVQSPHDTHPRAEEAES